MEEVKGEGGPSLDDFDMMVFRLDGGGIYPSWIKAVGGNKMPEGSLERAGHNENSDTKIKYDPVYFLDINKAF